MKNDKNQGNEALDAAYADLRSACEALKVSEVGQGYDVALTVWQEAEKKAGKALLDWQTVQALPNVKSIPVEHFEVAYKEAEKAEEEAEKARKEAWEALEASDVWKAYVVGYQKARDAA